MQYLNISCKLTTILSLVYKMNMLYMFCMTFLLAICSIKGVTTVKSNLGVINGTEVPISKFPYMASFRVKGEEAGSGVVIHKRWILTTAFLVSRFNVSDIEFRVGSNKYSSGGQVLEIQKVVVNEPFKMGSWDSDIALVKVKPIHFGRKVKPIALGTEDLKGGAKVVVSGWGEKNETGEPSEVLLAAEVTVLDWKTCNKTYSPELTPRMVCSFDKDVGPCARDFGDPLVLNGAVYGLYCGSHHCIPGNNPVLYTSVPEFYDWIKTTISNH